MVLDWDHDGLRGICRTYLEDPLRSHYQSKLEEMAQIVPVMTEVDSWKGLLPAFDVWKRSLVQSLAWDRLRASLESSCPFPFSLCSSLLSVATDVSRPLFLQLLSAHAEAACSDLVCVDLSRPLVPDAALEAKATSAVGTLTQVLDAVREADRLRTEQLAKLPGVMETFQLALHGALRHGRCSDAWFPCLSLLAEVRSADFEKLFYGLFLLRWSRGETWASTERETRDALGNALSPATRATMTQLLQRADHVLNEALVTVGGEEFRYDAAVDGRACVVQGDLVGFGGRTDARDAWCWLRTAWR